LLTEEIKKLLNLLINNFKMIKKVISTVLATGLLLSSVGLSNIVSANVNLMYDVPSDYSLKGHVETMVNEGIMSVYSDGAFKPFEVVERKKAARYIYNALAKKTNLISNNVDTNIQPFPDVPANDFYTKYISEMKRLGIMNGYSNGDFGYNNKLSRGELLAILLKTKQLANSDFIIPDYKSYPSLIQSSHRFSDVETTNTFYNAIYTSLDNNFISANDTFKTNATIVKGETAKLINNILYITLSDAGSITDTNTEIKESPFYKGTKIIVSSDLDLNIFDNRLELTLTADTA